MDYFKFLQSAHRHRSSVGGGGGGGGYGSSTEMGRFQSPRKALGTSVMDFARKSIMKHATTQPQTAIKNISRIVTESQGQPSLTDLLTATDANDDDDDDDDDDQDARFERDRDPISRRPSNTEAIHQEEAQLTRFTPSWMNRDCREFGVKMLPLTLK
ncbi:hypothetical protein BGX31_000538 [Mortierella sp. GBA43]|nr:hypothetical protein BGX31_000538 [Mortierella sp. GBA43]